MMSTKYVTTKGVPFASVFMYKISYNNKQHCVRSKLENYVTLLFILLSFPRSVYFSHVFIIIIIIIIVLNVHAPSEEKSDGSLVGKPEGKRPLGRPRRRWEDNIKMDLQEVGRGCGDWMELAQDKDRWLPLVSTVMNFRVP